MQANPQVDSSRYAKVIEVSRRVRWEIERDLIRGRRLDYTKPFLPAGLSLVDELDFLSAGDKRLLSQIQGNLSDKVERRSEVAFSDRRS